MAAVKTRVTCPHCGRACALREDTGGICRHGRHHRPACPGSGLTPVVGPLTEKQLDFCRYCWQTGDALPVARLLGTTYSSPDFESAIGVERASDFLAFLVDDARSWIVTAVRDYQQGAAV